MDAPCQKTRGGSPFEGVLPLAQGTMVVRDLALSISTMFGGVGRPCDGRDVLRVALMPRDESSDFLASLPARAA